MNPLRSVGARLSLALLLVVAGALGFVYLFVVPSLQSRLISSRLHQLDSAAKTLAHQYRIETPVPDVSDAAGTINARVVLFAVLSDGPPAELDVRDDSRSSGHSLDVVDDPIAVKAATTHRRARGTVERKDQRFAEVALPAGSGTVLLLSAALHDSLSDVHLVQRRVLLAGGFALLMVLIVGYGGAWFFARRLRRLEQAAERIARGQFDQPVVDRGRDEVGELARTFETMRRRLAQLDHARREFIANASHELRTPLFALGGFVELLTDEEMDEETRLEFLSSMRDQVARLAKLATELLDLSRLDAGQLSVEREPLSIGEVARVVAGDFAAVARTADHPLEVLDGDVLAVADEQRVMQIGRILVENAILHTPPGTAIRIRTESQNGVARLVVEDEGPGITPEHAQHVFDRFYRADDGHQASGSGLGLAIARELSELMGGKLELDSGPGRTVFALSLPAEQAQTTPTRAHAFAG